MNKYILAWHDVNPAYDTASYEHCRESGVGTNDFYNMFDGCAFW